MFGYLWGGKKTTPENEDATLATREALDAYGQFKCHIDGTLEYKPFLTFRAIIIRQSSRLFEAKRVELDERKLAAFREKNQKEYVTVFRQGQVEYQKSVFSITKVACEWIELSAHNYELTINKFMAEEKKRREVQQKDNLARMALQDKEITQTEEEAINAFKYSFKLNLEMFRKLQSLKYTTSPQNLQEIEVIEKSKSSDAIKIQFGFDLAHLAILGKHYKLENNVELTSFHKIVNAQKESEERAEYERAEPSPALIEALVKEGHELGPAQLKKDGTMTFEFFLSTSKLVFKYTHMQTAEGLAQHAVKRRAAIATGNDQEFQRLVLETANWEQLTQSLVQANLYQAINVEKHIFQKSTEMYLMEPSTCALYEDEIQILRDSLRTRPVQELTRDQVIDCTRRLQALTFEATKKMYDFVRAQRGSQQMINAAIKAEKMQNDDVFFNETGIEEEDVEPSLKRLGLEEDDEIKAIMDEYKVKTEEFLASKREAMMQQAIATQMAMEEAKQASEILEEEEKKAAAE